MDAGIVAALTGAGCTIISSLVTFFLTKRKYTAEVDSQQIKNMEAAFDTYKKMTDETINVLNKKVDTLQRENDSLRRQLDLMQNQMVNIFIGKKVGMFDNAKEEE